MNHTLLSNKEHLSKKQTEKFLTFKLEEKHYSVPVSKVDRVIGIKRLNNLIPGHNFLKDILEYKEQLVPVFDLRAIFNMEEKQYSKTALIVLVKAITNNIEKLIGILVDDASSTLKTTIQQESILDEEEIITILDEKFNFSLATLKIKTNKN